MKEVYSINIGAGLGWYYVSHPDSAQLLLQCSPNGKSNFCLRPLTASQSFAGKMHDANLTGRFVPQKYENIKIFCGAVFLIMSIVGWPWPLEPKRGLGANFWWESK